MQIVDGANLVENDAGAIGLAARDGWLYWTTTSVGADETSALAANDHNSLPLRPEIAVVSTVRIYYLSPASKSGKEAMAIGAANAE